jgi:hypothetical protein
VRYIVAAALVLAGAAAPALAGPPYLTDDPVPTETGHWEIYAFSAGEGRGSTLDADAGFDLNYGPTEGVQLTATLPLSFPHDPNEGWRAGTGDLELGVKYRFFDDRQVGVSAAIFPRVILPTSNLAADERARLLLPLWIGKDLGAGASLFGGGGYEVNPGHGNRNFWQAAAAATQDISRNVSIGAELAHQGPDASGAASQTRAGVGGIIKLGGPSSLLMSAGPTWAGRRTGYHFYGALGLNF